MTQIHSNPQYSHFNLNAEKSSSKIVFPIQEIEIADETTHQQNMSHPQTQNISEMESKSMEKISSNKLLIKQKDRFENKTIEKSMFTNMDDSVNELKIVYNPLEKLNEEERVKHTKKRKPMKLAAIQNVPQASNVKIVEQTEVANKSNSTLSNPTKKTTKNKGIIAPIRSIQIDDMNQFVVEAIPKNKKFVGAIKRNKTFTKQFFSHLDLIMNDDFKFITSTTKKSWALTSTFIVSSKSQNVSQQDQFYCGTVNSNFLGSQYNFYDKKENNSQLLATIIYNNQLSCSSMPCSLEVYILSPFHRYSDLAGVNDSNQLSLKQLYEIKQNQQNKKIIKLVNKKPRWDPQNSRYTLNFQGRARYSSIKNMILVQEEDEGKQVMILGKAGTDIYNIDIMYPLSPRLALSIASSIFDFKWVSQ